MSGRSLIVGADGLIGSALMAAVDKPATGTTRRNEAPDLLKLDLSDENFCIEQDFDVVFLCAAVASHRACTNDPVMAHRVNVVAAQRLAYQTLARGARVIFLSTDCVFGPENSKRDEGSPVDPGGHCYPRLKAQAEDALQQMARQHGFADRLCIVRLSKVVSARRQPFAQWMEALQTGQEIRPLNDLIFAPISLAYVANALRRVASLGCSGILHLSSALDLSYAEFMKAIAKRLGCMDRVRDTSVAQAGIKPDYCPRYSRLEMKRTTTETVISAQSVAQAVEDLIAEWRLLSGARRHCSGQTLPS